MNEALSSTIRYGKILSFNAERGYGFISETVTDANNKTTMLSHFYHVTSCDFEPRPQLVVKFRMGQGRRGLAAVDVQLFEPVTSADVVNALSGEK
jgi:cold shock CspA family protein